MTTSVRRLISLFSRSSGLVLHSFFQGASGKSAKAVRSALASVSIAATAGNLPSTRAATISASPVRTLASTLRRKCTRQPLPARALEHGRDRGGEPAVGIGDDQLHSVPSAVAQRAEELLQNASASLS